MKTSSKKLADVQNVYAGAEGKLWEFVMGEQIHIGGFPSSMDLAERAGIKPEMRGVDLCCCSGAGMRFLLKIKNVAHMTGVDATQHQIDLGLERMAEIGLSEKSTFVLSDVASINLPDGTFDFVWGEDAWCYVEDKQSMLNEAFRLLKSGGIMAFTDWVEGPVPMTTEEADRFLNFMKFPNFPNMDDYKQMIARAGFTLEDAHDTGRYAPCVDLYLKMLTEQHTFDALRIIGFDFALFEALGGELNFCQKLAHEGKLIQGLFLARKS